MSLRTQLKLHLKHAISHVAAAVCSDVQKPGVRCLVYHSIVDNAQKDPAQMTTPVSLFEAQMAFLAAHDYRVEPATTVVEQLSRGERLDPKTVVLTFDDGFADNYHRTLPVLRAYRFPATLFLIAVTLDGERRRLHNASDAEYLTWEQVHELRASGMVQFGCHSATHRNLRRLPAEVLREEIAGAKRRLEDGLGERITLFAYPFGSFGTWNGMVREAVERAGFLGAFTSVAGFNTLSTDRFLLRRSRVSWCDDLPAFDRLLRGAYDWYASLQRLQTFSARRTGLLNGPPVPDDGH